MALKGYRVVEKNADGYLYAVIELDDGSTFGQIVRGVTTVEQLDAAVAEAAGRVSPALVDTSALDALVGNYREVAQ